MRGTATSTVVVMGQRFMQGGVNQRDAGSDVEDYQQPQQITASPHYCSFAHCLSFTLFTNRESIPAD
jgi:hypothetical protein